MRRLLFRALIRAVSVIPLFLGSAWIYTFGFTTYRHHLAVIGLPLGIFTLSLGVGLLLLKRDIVEVSIFLIFLLIIGVGVAVVLSNL